MSPESGLELDRESQRLLVRMNPQKENIFCHDFFTYKKIVESFVGQRMMIIALKNFKSSIIFPKYTDSDAQFSSMI